MMGYGTAKINAHCDGEDCQHYAELEIPHLGGGCYDGSGLDETLEDKGWMITGDNKYYCPECADNVELTYTP